MQADVVIVGTGAAGVSAAFPLAEAGLDVLMVDPDEGAAGPAPPDEDYLDARRTDPDQWRWMLDRSLAGAAAASSPKFRVPTLSRVFAGFAAESRTWTEDFTLVGSLASGGLTSAWGAGVATFSAAELEDWPISRADLEPHYRSVARRIGVSGGVEDEMAGYFGLEADPPPALDAMGSLVEARYRQSRSRLLEEGFRMGRARLAVLTSDRAGRLACDLRGLCLWGCPRRSIYTASFDLDTLVRHRGLRHRSGLFVEAVIPAGEGYVLAARDRRSGARVEIRGRTIILAAGTIGSARLALGLAGATGRPLDFRSTPTAAFALFFPALLGRSPERGFGLAQHWFALDEGENEICGGLFPTTGLPLAEFVSRSPFARRLGLDVMRWLLPATAVGNLFAHGRYAQHRVTLEEDGRLLIRGGLDPGFDDHLRSAARRLRRLFRRLGGLALPGSFAQGAPGSDVHYAGTLPMRAVPGPFETSAFGELHGAPGLYVVDGAALPSLPPKSHTLTIMANAERIGSAIAARLQGAAALRRAG
jgi:choline dehydrogenase-like flavoprotein